MVLVVVMVAVVVVVVAVVADRRWDDHDDWRSGQCSPSRA